MRAEQELIGGGGLNGSTLHTEQAALDEGHEDLVEGCFVQPQESDNRSKKREAQRKRQRREEDAEYDDTGTNHNESPGGRGRGGQKRDRSGNQDPVPTRRSRRLRGQKVGDEAG
jgi:hypothetical protein